MSSALVMPSPVFGTLVEQLEVDTINITQGSDWYSNKHSAIKPPSTPPLYWVYQKGFFHRRYLH